MTNLFDGEADHLVPSASTILVESDLFTMAGRLIGHSCLHGGPTLSGLSPAFICFLTGGSQEEISSLLCLEDCPNLDQRETIALVGVGAIGLNYKVMLYTETVLLICLFCFSVMPRQGAVRGRKSTSSQFLSCLGPCHGS